MTLKPFLIAGLIGLTALSAPALSHAQESVAPLTAETVTDAQVNGFVRAAIGLEGLRKEYTRKIAEAETEDQRAELIEEADELAKKLVTRAKGITPDEYLAIGQLLQTDTGLQERVTKQAEVVKAEIAQLEQNKSDLKRLKAEEQFQMLNQ
ncbi:DUF4168 domain-containing protein [Roseovarius sp. 2305UL8-3]|uniref:DUF4168 domain-containing protein n=1 Tax=Roseovarius conchicola TaxID=3121636 RepID=UPI0035270C11